MPKTRWPILRTTALLLWLGACYAARYQLMENAHWVAVCDPTHPLLPCTLRATLGQLIHYQILPGLALLLAAPGFFLNGKGGRTLTWLALIPALPALVLYTTTPAAFAAVAALLRLVRTPTNNANANSAQISAHPSA